MRGHLRLASALGAAVVLVVGACGDSVFGGGGVRGSGTMATEMRDVSGFSGVTLQASGDVIIDVGGSESLEIEAEDNLLPILTSEVRDGVLELGASESFSPTRGITYRIGAAALDEIVINGSTDVAASGVAADEFEAVINGSGSIDPEGTATKLSVQINGSGDFDGEGLVATTGQVRVAGSGSAVVNVTDNLNVVINGSGDVEYIGDPTLTQSIPGSGDISQR